MKKLAILLAEDNVLNQKIIILNLKKYGLNIDVANNGLIAVEKYKPNKYDIIIMDIMMPVMDGYEAAREIRKIEKKNNSHIKIIGLTANTYDVDKERCISAGMDEFMTKPFDVELFKKVIKDLGFDLD